MVKEIRERKCVLTGERHPSYELIRFVCSPEGLVVPDVAAKLPGRGCWLLAKREVIETAVKKKILLRFGQQVILSSKKEDVEVIEDVSQKKVGSEIKNIKVDENISDLIEILLLKRCLDYISMANRAGYILSGYEKVKSAFKSGKTNILLTANDGAENGRSKMCQGLENLRIIDMFTRKDLSKAIGGENAVHLAALPGGITTSLLREISRYKQCKK